MSLKVECKICGKKYWSITSNHLATHGVTKKEYLERFPEDRNIMEECNFTAEFKIKSKDIDDYTASMIGRSIGLVTSRVE